MISPDTAVAAFGTEAVGHAATAAVATVMKRVHDLHNRDPPSKVRCLLDCEKYSISSRHATLSAWRFDAEVLEVYVNGILKVRPMIFLVMIFSGHERRRCGNIAISYN